MNAWTLAKYVLSLCGVALVLLGDSRGHPWVGYVGLGLLVAAFLLRFPQRRFAQQREDSAPTS